MTLLDGDYMSLDNKKKENKAIMCRQRIKKKRIKRYVFSQIKLINFFKSQNTNKPYFMPLEFKKNKKALH